MLVVAACPRRPSRAPPPRGGVTSSGDSVDAERAQRLVELRPGARADHGDDGAALREHPGDRELRRARAALRRERPRAVATSRLVPLPVLAGEAGQVGAEIAVRPAGREPLRRPREQARRRRVTPMPQLGEQREDLRLRAPADEGVLDLQVRDRVHGMGARGWSPHPPPTARSPARSPLFTSSAIAPIVSSMRHGRVEACRPVDVARGRGRGGRGCRRGSSGSRRGGRRRRASLPPARAGRRT